MSTPEELEVGRRNLLAQLKRELSTEAEVYPLDAATVRDLVEVLEGAAALDELRELVDYWRAMVEKPPIDEFDRGVRAARLEAIDALAALMGGVS